MKFRQHIPAFVDGIDPLQLDNVTIEDVLSNYKKWNQGQDEFAYYYSLIGDGEFEYKAHLMCQWKEEDKYRWYVLGYMSEIPLSLKEWKKPEQ